MDSQDGKRQLRRLRELRGWSWADEARAIKDMARRLGMDRLARTSVASIKRTIARWESDGAAATTPDERYQWILAHLFSQRADRFDVGPGSDFLCFLSALVAMGAPEVRVAELLDEVSAWVERAGHIPFGQRPGQTLDATAIAEAAVGFMSISRRVGTVPFVRSQLALAPFLVSLRSIDSAEQAPAAAHALAVRAFALAGRLAFELHDDHQAHAYYASALAHASNVPDSWLTASACTSLAMITMHRGDELAAAEQLASRAVQAALAGSSITIRARALAVQAEVAARRSMPRPAATALTLAHSYATRATADDPAGNGFDAARLAGFVGLYHLLVGHGADAVKHLDQAANGVTADADPVQRSIILADLAQGHISTALPEPEASVAVLHECADLVGRTRGRVAMGRIRTVRQSLRPWRGERFVADFDDHLYAALFD